MKLADEIVPIMDKCDESIASMGKGSVMSGFRMGTGMITLVGRLKRVKKLFDRLNRMSRGHNYTEEEKSAIEAKAREFTLRYQKYA